MDDEDRDSVELFFSCRKLADLDITSKSDPQVRLFYKKVNDWKICGKTETIRDNLNPNFSKSIILDYIFEMQQFFKVIVVDIDDIRNDNVYDVIGEAEFELGELMGSKNNMLILNLVESGRKNK